MAAISQSEYRDLDGLHLSSSALRRIFLDNLPDSAELPHWCAPVTLEDYQSRAFERPAWYWRICCTLQVQQGTPSNCRQLEHFRRPCACRRGADHRRSHTKRYSGLDTRGHGERIRPDCDEVQTLGGFSGKAGQAPAPLAWTARLNPSCPRRAGKRQYRQIAELRVFLRQ